MNALRALLLACALSCLATVGAADAPVAAATPIAQSSLLTLEGEMTKETLNVRLRRTAQTEPLSVTEFVASIDGKSHSPARNADGSWSVPLAGVPAGDHRLSVIVGHDGIRELLEGPLPAGTGAAAAAEGGLGNHKQMLWWILNIGIVCVAAYVLSRRMS